MCPPTEFHDALFSASFFPIEYSRQQDDSEEAPCSLSQLMRADGTGEEDRKLSCSFNNTNNDNDGSLDAAPPSASASSLLNDMMLALQQRKEQLLREEGQRGSISSSIEYRCGGDGLLQQLQSGASNNEQQDRLSLSPSPLFPGGADASATMTNAQQLQQTMQRLVASSSSSNNNTNTTNPLAAALLSLQPPPQQDHHQQNNTAGGTTTGTSTHHQQPIATVLDSTTVFLAPYYCDADDANPAPLNLVQPQQQQQQQQPSLLSALAAFAHQHQQQHPQLPTSTTAATATAACGQQQQPSETTTPPPLPPSAPAFQRRTISDTTGITATPTAGTKSVRRASSSSFMGFGGPVRQLQRAQSLKLNNNNNQSDAEQAGSNKRLRLLNGSAHDTSSNNSNRNNPDDQHKQPQSSQTPAAKASSSPTSNSLFVLDASSASSAQHSSSTALLMGREMNKALLHHSCRLFANELDVIECALQFDADAIRQPEPTECQHRAGSSQRNLLVPPAAAAGAGEDSVCSSSLTSTTGGDDNNNNNINNNNDAMSDWSQHEQRCSSSGSSGVVEIYKYAINVAIKNNASPQVVELLAQKAPDVLLLPDGPEECGSLSIFLSHCQYSDRPADDNAKIVHCLLRAHQGTAAVLDRQCNAPLHYAVRAAQRLPLQTLSLVHAAHPAALAQRNFHGQMPLDVAVTSPGTVPMAAADLLQKLLYSQLETESVRTMNLVDQDLDRSLRQEAAASASASNSGSRTTSPTLSSSSSNNKNNNSLHHGGSFFF